MAFKQISQEERDEAYAAGERAANENPEAQNPYAKRTVLWSEWNAGYNAAVSRRFS